ncbi:hypothetical protein HF675_00820 [Serratia sp. JUb9]|nr:MULTISPECIES: hypothetical protein [unclassified Serratia (in: enterobacteria)]MBU3894034.1 hypothetical protein [Serratia rubidaea]QNK32646.1 hypothetical protein HF675_00820 [Serratia sp. JUb9]
MTAALAESLCYRRFARYENFTHWKVSHAGGQAAGTKKAGCDGQPALMQG